MFDSLNREDSLEKEMATHSSILAWRIPRTEEPGGLYSPRHPKESDRTEQLKLKTKYPLGDHFSHLTSVEYIVTR